MVSPLEIAWSVLKALPEDSLYIEEDRTRPEQINVPGGYGRMPFMHLEQTRYKTLHPAIVGMLNRRNAGIRHGISNQGQIVGDLPITENYPGRPSQIMDVPTVTGDRPTSMYHMMGRPDGDPDFGTFVSDGNRTLTRTEDNPFTGYPEQSQVANIMDDDIERLNPGMRNVANASGKL